MISLLVFTSMLALIWAEPRFIKSSIKVDLKPPKSVRNLAARNVYTEWMTMPIDHFDPQNTDTFQMRYMFNEEFFGGPGSPIFILVGGEWDIVPEWLQDGNMYLMAEENRGFQIYTEHRFYGETLPYRNFTVENLRFLNVDQALADLAHFIKEIKKNAKFADSKIILYGGSYAANMVLWFKQRYPHLVVGAVASSAPIKAKVDYTGYLEVVHEAFLLEGGEQCISTIRQGIAETIAALSSEEGRLSIQQTYSLCSPLRYDSEYDLGYFSAHISWTFSRAVQEARPGTLTAICDDFATDYFGETPMQKIGGFIAWFLNLEHDDCWQIDYDEYVESYRVSNDHTAWYYQTCTEYGYFQTAPRSGTVFDQLVWLSVPFYVDLCKQAFDPKFDEAFVHDAVDRVNRKFGGLRPDVNNTINIHGRIDPWYLLGVHDRDLKPSSPTITVPRASHCFDMSEWQPTDTIRMTNAQQFARRMIARWLSE